MRNVVVTSGGGAEVLDGGTLVSEAADRGTGADDNQPEDVHTGSGGTSYGADTSFECTEDGCVAATSRGR